MLKGFVSQISFDGEVTTAVITLENQSTIIVPIEMLPRNIEIDDFLIIDHGSITIDPENDEKKELLMAALEQFINKKD